MDVILRAKILEENDNQLAEDVRINEDVSRLKLQMGESQNLNSSNKDLC
jgi:hypothetical protein